MPTCFPQRTKNHVADELSNRFFASSLPENWASHAPPKDYGVDLIVDIFDGEQATGLELLIQLKSTKLSNDKTFETVRLKTTTYNYLWNKLQVVLIVKFVIPQNEAYWILLKDVPIPNQSNKSFSIRIPKANRLSSIDWNFVKSYVEDVTQRKLTAQRERH